MALVGIALQIKYSVVFEGVFFGLWLVVAGWSGGGSATAMLAERRAARRVAMMPTALAGGFVGVGRGGAGSTCRLRLDRERQGDRCSNSWATSRGSAGRLAG